jgi:hypothetical protein
MNPHCLRAMFLAVGVLVADVAGKASTLSAPVPVVQVTDLFRPHVDPDDHWDLACVYALAHQGAFDLRGVLVDFPPTPDRDPDIAGVAQMNRITGLAVPVLVGSRRRDTPIASFDTDPAFAGVRAFLQLLRQAPRPVVIHVLGSCHDLATAARFEPQLFERNCAAVYLNAGSGTRDPAEATRLEYNVALDPASYAEIFRLPCPLDWLPCFEVTPGPPDSALRPGEYGSYYRFRQDAILPHLPDRVQNYFADMFRHGRPGAGSSPDPAGPLGWLRYLEGPRDTELLNRQGALERNMWCTAGFLHAAGHTVLPDGTLAPLATAASAVFTFDPIRVECGSRGVTRWSPDATATNRFILHVRDQARHGSAMTRAMKALLDTLP